MNKEAFKIALIQRHKTVRNMCELLGISYQTFYRKINGLSQFDAEEIRIMQRELPLTGQEVLDIFFSSELS